MTFCDWHDRLRKCYFLASASQLKYCLVLPKALLKWEFFYFIFIHSIKQHKTEWIINMHGWNIFRGLCVPKIMGFFSKLYNGCKLSCSICQKGLGKKKFGGKRPVNKMFAIVVSANGASEFFFKISIFNQSWRWSDCAFFSFLSSPYLIISYLFFFFSRLI